MWQAGAFDLSTLCLSPTEQLTVAALLDATGLADPDGPARLLPRSRRHPQRWPAKEMAATEMKEMPPPRRWRQKSRRQRDGKEPPPKRWHPQSRHQRDGVKRAGIKELPTSKSLTTELPHKRPLGTLIS